MALASVGAVESLAGTLPLISISMEVLLLDQLVLLVVRLRPLSRMLHPFCPVSVLLWETGTSG